VGFWRRLAASTLGLAAGFAIERAARASAGLAAARRVGRYARHPSEMPWRGWQMILARFGRALATGRILSIAAAVAFYALLSFVPCLSILITIYGFFSDPLTLADQLAPFTNLLPGSAAEIVRFEAMRLATASTRDLSLSLITGIAIAGWSGNAAMKAMFEALNNIYETPETRSFLRLNLVSMATTISSVLIAVSTLFALAILPLAMTYLPSLPVRVEWLARIDWIASLRWPAFWGLAVIGFSAIYWIGRARRPSSIFWLVPGALFGATIWVGVSWLFTWYAASLANYTALYGSLAAVVIFMTWLWLSACAALIGAQFNSAIEHQIS
jgi:membrane protein